MSIQESRIVVTGRTLTGGSEFQNASACETSFGLEGGAENYEVLLIIQKKRFNNALKSGKYSSDQNRILREKIDEINSRLSAIQRKNYLYVAVTENVHHFTS